MKRKTVTIITVVYNAEATIETCIQSVIAQSYPQIEYILIDGQSSDGTGEIIKKYQTHIQKWISEKDDGMYDAMNKGLQHSHGDIIGFLNADDVLAYPDVIADIVQVFESRGKDCCYGDLVYTAPENLQQTVRHWHVPDFKPEMLTRGIFPPHPTFYVKKAVYDRYGGFDCRLTSAADFELMVRFLLKYRISIAYLPNVLVKMRSGGKANKTPWHMLIGLRECYRAFALNGLSPSWRFVPGTLWFRIRQWMRYKEHEYVL